MGQYVVAVAGVLRRDRNADARRDVGSGPQDIHRLGEGVDDTLRDQLDKRDVVAGTKDDDELVEGR
jgi:hypothetical protein